MRRVLGLRVHADPGGSSLPTGVVRQLHDFIEGGDRESPVKGAILRPQLRQAFPCAQSLDLRKGEIFREPAGHGFAVDHLSAATRRKLRMLRHVSGASDLVLVPRYEHAVARHDQIGFDVIGTLLDREPVGFERMLRPLAAGAAMSNDKDLRNGAWVHHPPSLPHGQNRGSAMAEPRSSYHTPRFPSVGVLLPINRFRGPTSAYSRPEPTAILAVLWLRSNERAAMSLDRRTRRQ